MRCGTFALSDVGCLGGRRGLGGAQRRRAGTGDGDIIAIVLSCSVGHLCWTQGMSGAQEDLMQFEKIEQYSSIFAKLGGLSVLVETSWG